MLSGELRCLYAKSRNLRATVLDANPTVLFDVLFNTDSDFAGLPAEWAAAPNLRRTMVTRAPAPTRSFAATCPHALSAFRANANLPLENRTKIPTWYTQFGVDYIERQFAALNRLLHAATFIENHPYQYWGYIVTRPDAVLDHPLQLCAISEPHNHLYVALPGKVAGRGGWTNSPHTVRQHDHFDTRSIHHHVPDFLMFGARDFMMLWLQRFKVFEAICAMPFKQGTALLRPEELLNLWLEMNGVHAHQSKQGVRTLPIRVELARYAYRSEVGRNENNLCARTAESKGSLSSPTPPRNPAAASTEAAQLGQALCEVHKPDSPSVAFLVGGLSRGFSKPIRWLSLKRNILEAFGVPPQRYELLLYLKEYDLGPPSVKWQVGGNDSRNRSIYAADPRAELEQAIAALAPAEVHIDEDQDCDSRMRRRHDATCIARTISSSVPIGNVTAPLPPAGLGYWHTLDQLWKMLLRRETKRGAPFELVMFARPDLVHFLSVGPHCLYDRNVVYTSIGDDCNDLIGRTGIKFTQKCKLFSSSDFWFLAPRKYVEHLAGTLDRLMSCHITFQWNEDVFAREGPRVAGALGFKHMRHLGMLGGSLLQRRGPPSLSVQGVGANLDALGRHVDLVKLLYNASRSPTRHNQVLQNMSFST